MGIQRSDMTSASVELWDWLEAESESEEVYESNTSDSDMWGDDTTTMNSTGRMTEFQIGQTMGWPFTQDYRHVHEVWQWEDKMLFLVLYMLLWAMVVRGVHSWRGCSDRVAKHASTRAATEVKDEDALGGVPSGVGLTPEYPRDRLIYEFFLEQALQRPADVALIVPENISSRRRSVVTYGQLEEAIHQLARTLNQLGIQPGSIVALCMQRSCAQVVAVHAVLVAGGGYLPIDAEMPETRFRLILGDSEASALLADDSNVFCARVAAEMSIPLVSLEESGAPGAFKLHPKSTKEVQENVNRGRPQAADLAMLIYTSGSTGKPKGIIYDHTHLLHGAWFWAEEHSITDRSVLFQKSPYFWAVIEWEMFPALMKGGSLVLASPQGHKSPEYLARVIKQEGVTTLMITPSVLDLVLDVHQAEGNGAPLGSLDHITTVGEPLPTDVANRAATMPGMKATVRNFYGASESGCTIYRVPKSGIDMELFPGKAPAGLPQPHTEVYLMAVGVRPFQPVKDGQEGEICFGGVLAAGYFKLPELTKKSFANSLDYGRIYATGDLGRWRGGVLEVIGRIDRQVKVNGVRIEPGEIESVLRKYTAPAEDPLDIEEAPEIEASAAVLQAAVVATSEPAALVAFVSLREGTKALERADLQRHCSENLAQAYVPRHYVIMREGLPLLPNDKINYQKLKELADTHNMESQETVIDSLGQMRSMSRWVITENEIIHRCYAFWMLGVLMDHYALCAMDNDPDDPRSESVLPVCTALAMKQVRPWSEVLIRSLGNDQDLFGFIMLGAYQDSRPEHPGKKKHMALNWLDLYMFGLYLFIALPLPHMMSFITGGWAWPNESWTAAYVGHGPEPSSWFGLEYLEHATAAAGHRWYILMVLQAKIFVRLCDKACVPPWLQIVVAAWASWLGPLFSGDFCKDTDLPTAAKLPLIWIFDGCNIWIRWVEWYATFYVICFHYLRPTVTWVTQRTPKGTTWAAAATGTSMTLGVVMALFHYPNTMLETGEDNSLWLFEFLVTIVQPSLFVLGTSCWTWNASWWGNTTLGCYMIHFCFRDRFTELFHYLARVLVWDFTGLLLPAAMIFVCCAFMTTIGPLGHYVLISPQLFLSQICSGRQRTCLSTTVSQLYAASPFKQFTTKNIDGKSS
eukprot:TRINITY_DN2120_c0_g3_i1.p1 TRINITY_DN2120_c0_g3~~TRINITY_DN2120_c0_g3_i1.p1  ORF type:complete len:1142 (+),score=165.38 TRINITY_DN2120_c0_g3_i1:59-3484(+)